MNCCCRFGGPRFGVPETGDRALNPKRIRGSSVETREGDFKTNLVGLEVLGWCFVGFQKVSKALNALDFEL